MLPFENLSDDKGAAYFADGIQDEILTKLASIADLKVISRTSTAKYKSKPEDLKTVSQQLGVATVLEGSVQKANDKVRVNVQLIDARADSHLWAKSTIAKSKMSLRWKARWRRKSPIRLQAKLSPAEATKLATAPTKDTAAYDLFLKGEFEQRVANSNFRPESFDQATRLVQGSDRARPEFCPGHRATGYLPAAASLADRSVERSGVDGGRQIGKAGADTRARSRRSTCRARSVLLLRLSRVRAGVN